MAVYTLILSMKEITERTSVMQQNKGAVRVTSDDKIISVSIISEYGIAVIESRL